MTSFSKLLSCAGSGYNKQKLSREERIRTEPDKERGSEAFTGEINMSNVSRKSAESKGLDLPNQKKKKSMFNFF